MAMATPGLLALRNVLGSFFIADGSCLSSSNNDLVSASNSYKIALKSLFVKSSHS